MNKRVKWIGVAVVVVLILLIARCARPVAVEGSVQALSAPVKRGPLVITVRGAGKSGPRMPTSIFLSPSNNCSAEEKNG